MAGVGRSLFGGRFKRTDLSKEGQDQAAVVAESAFFDTTAPPTIAPGGVASTAVAGGVNLVAPPGTTINPGGVASSQAAGGAQLASLPWSAYETEVLADSPIRWWKLDETSGTVADDATNNADGVYVNGPTFGVAGMVVDAGTAVQLSAASAEVIRGPTPDFYQSDFTIEFWIKWTSGNAPVRDNTSTTGNGTAPLVSVGTKLSFVCMSETTTTTVDTSAVRDGQPHHVVLTRAYGGGAGGVAKLYIDGVLIKTGIANDGASVSTPWWFGSDGANLFYADTTFDHLVLYPAVLSAARVLVHYDTGTTGIGATEDLPVGGVTASGTTGGAALTTVPADPLSVGGVSASGITGGADVATSTVPTDPLIVGGVAASGTTGGAALTTVHEITPGGVGATGVAGGAVVSSVSLDTIYPGGVASVSDAGSVLMTGPVPPRLPENFYANWSSGYHVGAIGASRPNQRVMLRTGRFWRRHANWHGPEMDVKIFGAPAKPWQAFWSPEPPAEEYREIPNVREVRFEQSLDQNGITSATITIENIYYRAEAAGHHSIKRGYMAPLRGYVGPDQTPIVDEQGETLTQNEWYGLLGRESQITVYQGYGGEEIKAFTGLIDDVDTTSRPDVITITARDFGKVLNDERIFGWNKEPLVKDPVIFIDNDEADDISLVGSDANASSEQGTHKAENVLDDDGDTSWWSDSHPVPNVTEYIEIRLPEGRYDDFRINMLDGGADLYVGMNPKSLDDDSDPTWDGEALTPNQWIDGGSGLTVPGANGGHPYMRLIESVEDGKHTFKLLPREGVLRVGDNTLLRVSLRNLVGSSTPDYVAAVVALKGRKRLLSQEAKQQHWVRVGDASDVVRQILRWAGFKHWEVDDSGTSLSKRFVTNRGMTYMDVIQRMKDTLGFTFFISDPSNSQYSLGVPVFRKSLIVTDADPVVTIDDNSLLNAIDVKQSDESLAYIIRVRGRVSSNGQGLGSDTEKRIMFTFRPPWSYQLGSGIIDKLGGVIKHVIYTDKMFKTKDDIKFGAYYIALQEALASIQATAQIPGNPGPQLDDHVGLLDLGTGVTSRLSVQSRSSTFTHGADQTSWALTLGGGLVDEPDVSAMVAIIEAARRA